MKNKKNHKNKKNPVKKRPSKRLVSSVLKNYNIRERFPFNLNARTFCKDHTKPMFYI